MVLLLTLLSPYLLDPECAKGTLFLALTIRERSSRKSIRKVQRNYEVFQRLYRCLDKARIPRRSQLNEEQDLSEPERLHPMSLSSLKPKKTSALQIGSREGGEASLVEHLPSVKIGLVLHLSTDRASLADWAFSAEFQDSGTKKFLFITGRIRLSILVLEKWVVPVSFYPIEAVVPIATVLRPLVGVLSAALAVEFFLISSATSRGLLTRLCFLSGPLLNKNVGRKSVRRLSVGKAKASLLLLLELHKKDGSGEKSYPQAFAYRMVEGGRGQDHRKREEQGRRSFLKEDDSKINSKRRIGCLKAGQKSGNFLRDALLRYDAPFFEVDSPRSNDKEPKAKMAAEESDG
ncbi:hypothetical protein L1987_89199 [Smallanthus sonchifolius]|nr:hypothetical protein L1987_89199 [Smallanthus sonchifolius]